MPQIEFDSTSDYRRPDLYSTAKLRWIFFTFRYLEFLAVMQWQLTTYLRTAAAQQIESVTLTV
ncbi:hypothetical protein RGR602_PB00097 (plasmid) [Rhizobium gallicum bv. gallicum R602sp]|uniref:Uncharacterized protein n=1 Tax=Rhizobium gallicum bv. gallicum R602sp TaxID=1041138 RepID=A0A0B4X8Z9_9HYPH|nr:hypothetical protein RGR602_PB00097 [Rhizobium gallicum bv. gallicum R602sp]